jgi:hypothetical protein
MASISKRQLVKGAAFDVRYRDPNGRARMKTFRRADEARAFAKTVEADVIRSDYLQPALARTRFDQRAEDWLRSTADLRPKTRVGYESMLRVNVLPHFAGWQVGRIEATHVRQYLASCGREAPGRGPSAPPARHSASYWPPPSRAALCERILAAAFASPVPSRWRWPFSAWTRCWRSPTPCGGPSTACSFASPPCLGFGPVRSAPCGSAGWTCCGGGSRWPRASPR